MITQRRKLKDAKFSDMQADTILEVTETVGPDLGTKSDLTLFKVETRIFFLLLLCVVSISAPKGTPLGDSITGVFALIK